MEKIQEAAAAAVVSGSSGSRSLVVAVEKEEEAIVRTYKVFHLIRAQSDLQKRAVNRRLPF